MRRAIFIAVISLLVVGTFVVWIVNTERAAETKPSLDVTSILMVAVAVVVLFYAALAVLKRIRDAKNNLPSEDEMSKKILRRGAATSYYVSLYLWLAIMFFEENINLERHTLIGAGILGMAIIYALSWLFHRFILTPHD